MAENQVVVFADDVSKWWEAVSFVQTRGETIPVKNLANETVAVIAPEGHQPRRDDEVATWLKAKRDEWYVSSQHRLTPSEARARTIYTAIDDLLDNYRLHADTGTSLSEHVSDGGHENL